ncbi:Efflux pump periplasmic linker BepF [Thalassoglobus neptunius]|uniref:Efflux pump periplasmic linker BepF n=1 Tax=Thalassoglobus neptunius TaxID=1938619 RepID=A0A5C5VWJ5_9PLAN|nr:efflux RND transporter periplasmic adaptor subunit [Thalassoglobus neptunius]TWT42988.1 Efflux pump periplasmic linker BepF [Thalassoglobus neptunius]
MLEVLLLCSLLGGDVDHPTVKTDTVSISFIDDVELSCEEPGRLASVDVQVGMTVEEGQRIARQEDSSARIDVERAESQLRMAHFASQNDLEYQLQLKARDIARSELERAEESRKQYAKSVSQSEIDRLKFALDETELKIEQAKFQQEMKRLEAQLREDELAIAQNKLARRELRSPVSGMVVEVNYQPGEWIQPGEPIARIVRVDRVRAEGLIPASVVRVRRGQPASVSFILDDGTESVHSGIVTFVDPEIDPITEQVRVQAEIENTNGTLRPGQHPRMTIELIEPTNDTAQMKDSVQEKNGSEEKLSSNTSESPE